MQKFDKSPHSHYRGPFDMKTDVCARFRPGRTRSQLRISRIESLPRFDEFKLTVAGGNAAPSATGWGCWTPLPVALVWESTEGPWGADPIKSGHFGPYTTSPGHAAPIQMKPFFFNSTGPPAGFIGRTPLTVACVQVTPRGPWGGEPIKSGHLEPFTSPGWAPAGPGHRFAAGARPALTTKRAGETA
jgi:hypothetical protein